MVLLVLYTEKLRMRLRLGSSSAVITAQTALPVALYRFRKSQAWLPQISARRSGVCERGWDWFFVARSSTAERGNAPVGAQKRFGTRGSTSARRLNSRVRRVDGWAFCCSDRAEFRAFTPPPQLEERFRLLAVNICCNAGP